MNRILVLVIVLLVMCIVDSNNAHAQNNSDESRNSFPFPTKWFLELKDTQYCPAAVMEGQLYDKAGNAFATFDERDQLKWLTMIPYKVSIVWLSFAENQFYETTFSLPGDSIIALLKSGSGYEESDKSDIETPERVYQPYRFTDIRFLLFMGGTVSVKLRSDFNIIEVAQSKAKKIVGIPAAYYRFLGEDGKRKPEDLINDYYSSESIFNKMSLKFLHKYGLKRLECFHSPLLYDYNIQVERTDGAFQPRQVQTDYLNGDVRVYYEKEIHHLTDTISRGALQYITVNYGEEKSLDVRFEKEYTTHFFEENLRAPMSFVLLFNDEQRKVEAFLKNGLETIPIPEDKMRYTFSIDHRSYSNYGIGAPDKEKYEKYW